MDVDRYRMWQERETLVKRFENHVLKVQQTNKYRHASVDSNLNRNDIRRRLNLQCEICQKKFRSFATLQLHLQSQRHSWKVQRGFEMNVTTADALAWKKDAFEMLRHDPKKALLLLIKAGKALTHDGQNKEAEVCLEKVVSVLQREIDKCTMGRSRKEFNKKGPALEQKSFSFDIEDPVPKRSSLTKSNSLESGDGSDRSEKTKESSRQQRAKRARMDKLKQMYRHYETQRGTKDLYQTMLKCYGEYLNDTYDFDHKIQPNCSPSQEALMKRDLVLTELADTERDYVNDLEIVIEKIIPIFHTCDVSPGLQGATHVIFGNIDEIYQWHKRFFLEKLEDCLEEPDLLGSTFAEEEEIMSSMYAEYCQNKPNADDLMMKHDEEIEIVYSSHFGNDKLHLNDYLIKPVQRLMKYQLLLQNVVKYTEKAGEDATAMADALEVMEVVPKRANDKMNVALIQHGMDKNLLDYELIFQDILEVSFGRSKTKPRRMRAFLFEEFLIFTEPIEREGRLPIFRFAMEGKTLRMGLTESVENDKLKFAIWFRKFKTSDIFICRAESQSRKESWLQVLGDLISVQLGPRAAISREPTEVARRRTQRPKTWSAEALVRQATFGHPREGSMSSKLKKSIEKFVMEELFVGVEIANDDDSRKHHYQRSQSLKDDMYGKSYTEAEKETVDEPSIVEEPEVDSRQQSDTSDTESYDRNNNSSNKIDDEETVNGDVSELGLDSVPRQHKLSVVWEGELGLATESTHIKAGLETKHETPLVERKNDFDDVFLESTSESDKRLRLPNGFVRGYSTGKLNCKTNDNEPLNTCVNKTDRAGTDREERNFNISKETPLLEQIVFQHRRSFSSPAVLGNCLDFEKDPQDVTISAIFSADELPQYKVALSEAQYLLGSVHSLEKPGTAFQLFDSALEMFFDVPELKTFTEIHNSREDLLKRCTSLYQSLKADKSFSTFKSPENTEFYGYQGLFSLLVLYARSVRESQPNWAIVLYSLAVASATTESCWTDSWKIFQKLAQLYRQQGVFSDAVDSLVDAHYIQLETGDLLAACRDLETAFKTAVNARVIEKCARLESLAEVLVDNLRHYSIDSDATVLSFFCNMSRALRTEDREWFEFNMDLLDTLCLKFKNGEAAEIEKIFRQVRDSLVEDASCR